VAKNGVRNLASVVSRRCLANRLSGTIRPPAQRMSFSHPLGRRKRVMGALVQRAAALWKDMLETLH